MNRPPLDVKSIETKTFKYHLISQFLNGISLGVVTMQDIILKKSLQGDDFQIMMLAMIVSTAFLFSYYGTEIIHRSYNKARAIMIMGIVGKAVLFLLPLFPVSVWFLFCIAVNSFIDSMLLSSWNIIYKHNYTEQNRSKLFSYASMVSTIMTLISSTVFGFILEIDYNFFKYLFPAAALFGMGTYYNLSKMISLTSNDAYTEQNKIHQKISIKLVFDIIILPIRHIIKVFRENPSFKRFEVNFFIYGMGFMIITPAVPVFLVDYLHLGYAPISLAKGFFFHLSFITLTPLMGKILGSGNPSRFCGVMFFVLSIYPILLYSAHIFSYLLTPFIITDIAFFIFGIGMSGVTIAWTLGSIYYSPKRQVANYQSIHITLTGLRGLFTPALGYLIMIEISMVAVFIASALLFLLSGVLMFYERRRKLL